MKTYKNTIVVFGCTGTVGTYVLEELVKRDCNVRGVLRHPERAHPIPVHNHSNLTYVSANLDNPKELEAACLQSDVVFLLTATQPKQIEYETNVILAAQKCGIKRLVKLSAPVIQPPGHVEVSEWHRTIESQLEQTTMEYCCIRPYAFMQNWERNTFTIKRFGKFYGTMEDAPRNYVDARDVAEIAVQLLLQEHPLELRAITLTGPEAISHYEMAHRLSKVTGRKIEYINVDKEEFLQILTKRAKLPLWLANHIVELDELAVKVPEPKMGNTEQYLKERPRLMNEYLLEAKDGFMEVPFWKILGT